MSVSSAANTRPSIRAARALGAISTLATVGMLLSPAHSLNAQIPAAVESAWEFRVSSGAFVPTGNQRNFLKDANATAAQLSWLVRPALAVTSTFAWARSRDVHAVDSPKLDVFSSDLGIEARSAQRFADRTVSFSPFIGLGAGVRSYNYRNLNVDATNNLAGYAAAGGELGMGRVGVRLEVRDYASGFKPLVGAGRSDTRNDVVMMLGVRFNRHGASEQ